MTTEINIPDDLVDDMYVEIIDNVYYVRSIQYGLINIAGSASAAQAYLDFISDHPLNSGVF